MDEKFYEKLLNIKTCGEQKIFNESMHYNRYEPTSYTALESLFKEYTLSSDDSIIDFGCGMGRLNFYVNHFYDTKVTAIEMNNFFYKEAVNNKKNYLNKNKKIKDNINFLNCFAEKYKIEPEDNKFYFFNPFSVQIFTKVLNNILLSLDECEKSVELILYYPSEDYIYYLENKTAFTLVNEIRLPNLYSKDNRQRFLIYELSYIK